MATRPTSGTRAVLDTPAATDHFSRIDGSLHCEGVSLERLAAEFGTPLYIYSRQSILDRFHEVERAFGEVDPLIAFSVKANGNLSVLELLAEAGAGADIVSGGELFRALRAGVPAERIVFSGVGKTEPELVAALEAGIHGFNVESEEELLTLDRLARTRGVRAPIALRINPDIMSRTPHAYTRTGHLESKFGIPSEVALELYREAAALPGLEVRGIAVHIGSQVEGVDAYRQALLHLLDLVEILRAEGISLEYLDLGGGFHVPYEPEGQMADGRSAGARGQIDELAEFVIPRIKGAGLRLILEPGRYIVARAGVLVTRVLALKEMGERLFVITDAGMNDLLRPSHYESYHHLETVESHPDRPLVEVDVVGPVCESGDFLALGRELERPRRGDLLALRTVGAYGFVMSSQYNARTRPAEVMVEAGQARLIRARESYEDLVRGETLRGKG